MVSIGDSEFTKKLKLYSTEHTSQNSYKRRKKESYKNSIKNYNKKYLKKLLIINFKKLLKNLQT